jgi:hypothetical protein
MFRQTTTAFGLALSLAVAYGCAESMGSPTSPVSPAALTDAAADGSTLKVTAPTLQSPIGGVRIDNLEPVFRIQNSRARFGTTPALTYRFEVQTMASVVVGTSGAVPAGNSTTSWEFPTEQTLDTRYKWRVRAEYASRVGPWSGFSEYLTIDYRGLNPRPANGQWPSTGDAVAAYITDSWPEYLEEESTLAQRIEHMEFIRDRFIEAGICGGLDFAWNLKRGVGPRSHDAIAWRKPNGFVEVVDIASAFDDNTIPMILHFAIVAGPSGYDRYTDHPGC